jgi:hypothetical protein
MTTKTHDWSTVVDAVVQRNPHEGTFELLIYNADESLARSIDLDSVGMRAALLEATAFIKSCGWDPLGRWSEDADSEPIRKFRKQAAA